MSYDFTMFQLKEGEDPLLCARKLRKSKIENISEIDWKTERRKKEIANALLEKNPRFGLWEPDWDTLLNKETLSDSERNILETRCIGLTDQADDSGIQISIYDREISFSIPSWRSVDDMDAIFQRVFEYIDIVHRKTGYVVYDPQSKVIFDPAKRKIATLKEYDAFSNLFLTHEWQQYLTHRKRPWWKLW